MHNLKNTKTINTRLDTIEKSNDKRTEDESIEVSRKIEDMEKRLETKIRNFIEETKRKDTPNVTVDNHSEPMEEQELNTGAPEQEKEKSSRQTVIVDMTTEQESRRNYKKALLKDSNPDRVSIQPSLTRNVTAEDLMEEMATTIGFRGITAEMIKHWEWKIEENLLQEVDDDKIFKHSDHDEARTDTIKDICYNKLGFEECNIKICKISKICYKSEITNTVG